MMPIYISVGALVGLSILIIFVGIDNVIHSQSSAEQRVENYIRRAGDLDAQQTGKARAGGRTLSGLPFTQQLATDLAQADIKLTPSEFLMLNIGLVIAAFVLSFIVRGDLIVSVVLAAVAGYAPRLFIRFKQGQRLAAFGNQLSDTLVLISNSLRTGYSLQQSLDTVAKELPPPISVEFGRVTREIGLGLTIGEALANLTRRVPTQDLDLVVTAINVNHEVGGNLAEILDTIAFTIRERIRIQGDIRALTAQQRISGNVLGLLPVVLGFVMYAMNQKYISGFWTGNDPTCGISMLVVGGIMVAIGYYVVQRIASIEV